VPLHPLAIPVTGIPKPVRADISVETLPINNISPSRALSVSAREGGKAKYRKYYDKIGIIKICQKHG
jgi:hypothetical protein